MAPSKVTFSMMRQYINQCRGTSEVNTDLGLLLSSYYHSIAFQSDAGLTRRMLIRTSLLDYEGGPLIPNPGQDYDFSFLPLYTVKRRSTGLSGADPGRCV